ncbi:tyrosine protein phosphatase yvh1 [Lithohypha guttulata]|uniref:tyrosine protein phosphatase yvh1 n=1 Tax=Lithohypha guttulata TaxID=1690604 RepID=UPI002DDE0997|nr:tyrosine protein phosphatase yvh1 [Lithohypha guttulata]
MEPTLDKCPGYNLYIGGFIGLRRPQALKNANITHIVSVLDWEFKDDAPLIRGYKHFHIPVDDVEDENLLEWFPRSNAFIQQGLDYRPDRGPNSSSGVNNLDEKGSGVYIHCAMGKSRSATILLAYLLWLSRQTPLAQGSEISDMVALPRKPLSVVEALQLLRQGRPIAEPNEGFMDQLHMYEDMGCPTTEKELTNHKIYRRWMNRRKVEESLRTMQAPEMENIIFEDEPFEKEANTSSKERMTEIAPGILAPDGTTEDKARQHPHLQAMSQVSIKCRKCRHVLATTPFVVEHEPPPHRDPNSHEQPHKDGTPLPPPQCAHIFLHPLSWMKEVLAEGKMEGRLTCPNKKCGANVGKFAWTGLRCSCGGWVTPGFGIIRTKVDEIVNQRRPSPSSFANKPSTQSAGQDTSCSTGSTSALRHPPGLKSKGNL